MMADKPTPRKPNAGKKQEAEKDGEKKTSEGNQKYKRQPQAAEESDEEDYLRILHAT
jgi:hypothetical protein